MIVYGQAVADFVAANIEGCAAGFGNNTAIGFTDAAGALVAGVVYHNWQPQGGVIELSAASTCRNWLSKDNLHTVFAYPFDQVGVQLCVARISEHNTRARRIWRALGASETIIPRLRGLNEAEAIYTLTAEAWRGSKFSKGNSNG